MERKKDTFRVRSEKTLAEGWDGGVLGYWQLPSGGKGRRHKNKGGGLNRCGELWCKKESEHKRAQNKTASGRETKIPYELLPRQIP